LEHDRKYNLKHEIIKPTQQLAFSLGCRLRCTAGRPEAMSNRLGLDLDTGVETDSQQPERDHRQALPSHFDIISDASVFVLFHLMG
jgi:hypothetical protein